MSSSVPALDIELPAIVLFSHRGEIVTILLKTIFYKHGPASAREWVDGVFQGENSS
jgi:hypothetical protein